MDTRTGVVMESDELRKKLGDEAMGKFAREIDIANLKPERRQELVATGSTKVGRNDPCPCASGKKFKRCCFDVYGHRRITKL